MTFKTTTLRSLAAAAIIATGSAFVAVPAIAAPKGPSNSAHYEQADGCDHGRTGKPCKKDPQPTKGKDCLVHGNWGGVNEDHCAPAVIVDHETS